MSLFNQPTQLSIAARVLAEKNILPTELDSAGLRGLDAALKRQSILSAETTQVYLLQTYREKIGGILNPQPGAGETTTQFSPPEVRAAIKDLLTAVGYQPKEGEAGTIKDLSSDARIDLVVKTNVQLSQGAGQFLQSQDERVIVAFPCWELFRLEARKDERDWATRWKLCAQVVGDVDAFRVQGETGRMIARKDSPIWQALGDGEDGSDDTLGNPFPPFAFNSGMDVRDIGYDEAVALGAIKAGDVVEANVPDDLSKLFQAV